MTDKELIEWYKNGATRTEGMSDKEYELAKNNAIYASQAQLQSDNLSAQQQAVEKAKTSSEQGASITNEKLMKYLQQKHLASGVAVGQTGSDFINANNAYMQNRAMIANNASAQQSDLLQQYANNQLQLGSDKLSNETSILDKYREIDYRAEQDAYNRDRDSEMDDRYREELEYSRNQDAYMKMTTEQDRAYSQVLATLESGMFNSAAEFDAVIEQMKGSLSDSDYRYLKSNSNYLFNNPDQKQADKDYAEYSESGDSKTDSTGITLNTNGQTGHFAKGMLFSVNYDGGVFRVKSNGEATDSGVLNEAKNHANNEVFYYNGNLYLKNGGRAYIVVSRSTYKKHWDVLMNAVKNG